MSKEINITVCLGSACYARGNEDHLNYIEDYIRLNNLDAKIEISGSRCEGKCSDGPNLIINGTVYNHVNAVMLKEILDSIRDGLAVGEKK